MGYLALGTAVIAFGLGYFLGERNNVRDIRNLAIIAMLAALLGSASFAYAFIFACRDPQGDDFCGLGYTLLGYALTRIGLLAGLMACGVALRITLRLRKYGQIVFILVGGLLPLCLPLVSLEIRLQLFMLGQAWEGFYSLYNSLQFLAAGMTPYILSAIAPLPLLIYALYVARQAPPAPADAAGGLA